MEYLKEKQIEKIMEEVFRITVKELEEKYNYIVEKLKEEWKTGCIDDYKRILTGGFDVNTEAGNIVISVGWEQPNNNEYYPGYEHISILDNDYNYETTSESDVFIGCEQDDPDYLYYLETGKISDIMYECAVLECPIRCKDFDDVVTEIVGILKDDDDEEREV
jgi:hypothetical protein